MKKTSFLGLTTLATLGVTVGLVAQETQEAAAPSPAAIARMTPGPMHAKLEPLVGDWSMSGKWRMGPDAPWETFEAAVTREWILDGRFVQEKVESEFLGQSFEGIGLIGYDNTREQFTMVWIENMQTGTWFSTGRMEGGKLVFEGENSDAMTGEKNRWAKSVIDLGVDSQTYQGYSKDKAGKEFLSMEMVAERL